MSRATPLHRASWRASIAGATFLLLGAGSLLTTGCRPSTSAPRTSFVVQIAEYPPSLDPALHYDSLSVSVVGKVFSGLVELDPATLEIRPDLAERWEVLENGRVLRFHVRRAARFHNGREVVADDFRFAFERLLRHEPPAPAAWILMPLRGAAAFARGEAAMIAGLHVEDAQTLTLELDAPFTPFLQHLAMPNASAVAREAVAGGGLPVGTGPFRVESADPVAGTISLVAFEGWARGRPQLDRIEMRVVADPGRALERYWQGELDMLTHLPLAPWSSWRSELGSDLRQWPISSLAYLVASPKRLPANWPLRKVLAQAIDRLALCEEIHGQPATGILPPGIPGHDPQLPSQSFRPRDAPTTLAAAGHPEGRDLPELELWVTERHELEAVASSLVAQLAAVGLRVKVHPVAWNELLAAAASGEFDLLLISWDADYPDPDNFLFPLLHSSQCGAKNYACYRNPELDRLVDAARRAGATSERLELYRRAEALALRDAPILPLYYPTETIVVRTGWEGLQLHPLGWQEVALDALRWRGP